MLIGESNVTSTAGNLRLSHEVHADVVHRVNRVSGSVGSNHEISVVKETSSSPLKSSQVTVVD